MVPSLRRSAIALMTRLTRPEDLRMQAVALGGVQRQGKTDADTLLMVVVLGIMVRGPTSIAQLGHVYTEVSGRTLARSSFLGRLPPARVRGYAGGPCRMVDHEFRVIALRRPSGEYALYVTHAPPSMLAAEEAWNVYRLRWEVEKASFTKISPSEASSSVKTASLASSPTSFLKFSSTTISPGW